ncbi:MAG: hypothetical protein K6A38_11095 [Lachnospiraceae bacterium]|nr:hypothetical protein [Lachnospiraceae bacterium]
MKKVMIIIASLVLSLGCSVCTYAVPKTMENGDIFDAELYASLYPDVVAVYGTSESALYSHYLKYGKKEGRIAYVPTSTTPAATPATAATTEQQKVIDSLIAYMKNPVQNPVTLSRAFFVNTSFSPVSAEFESTIVSALKNAGYTLTPSTRVVKGVRAWDGVVYSVTTYNIKGNGLIVPSSFSLHDDPTCKEVSCNVYVK